MRFESPGPGRRAARSRIAVFLRIAARTSAAWLFAAFVLGNAALFAQSSQPQRANLPSAMAYDANGNLFFADATLNQVLEVSVGGVLSIVVGTGEQGFGGDGGQATNALLNQPEGLALGADGTIFIADTGNNRIRAVSQGIIKTIAGTGDRKDAGDGAAATSASFFRPSALAVTADGRVLVCDAGSHRVRMITSGIVQAFAGSGVQGFAGDGGPAVNAQLDSPEGIAVLSDGRVVIADSHNQRLRVVGTNATLTTFAGRGVSGYSGDGGPATAATLSLPRGVSATSDGAVIFADANNQRLRRVDANGIISTLAGNGTQGSSRDETDASASLLNVPKAVAFSPYGASTIGDLSASLRAVAANGKVYLVPAPASRTSSVALTLLDATYGQLHASVTVTAAAMPQGNVEVGEGTNVLASGVLQNGGFSAQLSTAPAGSHALTARYAGDGVNPASTSAALTVLVQPADATFRAAPATVAYGEPFPSFSGEVRGILPQDATKVSVTYSAGATPLANVGSYPINAVLGGSASGNYLLKPASDSGSLTVHQAKSNTLFQATAQTSYAGLPLQLAATVTPQFAGTPTGELDFLENGVVIARGTVRNGVVNATYLNPVVGTHALTASYLGDTNFLQSSTQPLSIVVGAIPDFTITPSSASQSVQAGLIASFVLSVASQGGPFTGAVNFSASGLPAGAQASFLPTAVVPGASGANTTLSIQTPAVHALDKRFPADKQLVLAAVPLCLLFFRRRRRLSVAAIACSLLLVSIAGCGARTVGGGGDAPSSKSYAVQITATSTNIAGNVVTHSSTVTLIVQ